MPDGKAKREVPSSIPDVKLRGRVLDLMRRLHGNLDAVCGVHSLVQAIAAATGEDPWTAVDSALSAPSREAFIALEELRDLLGAPFDEPHFGVGKED